MCVCVTVCRYCNTLPGGCRQRGVWGLLALILSAASGLLTRLGLPLGLVLSSSVSWCPQL